MGKEKKAVMGKNAKIIIFSLIGLAVLGGVAALLMLTAPKEEQTPVKHDEFAEPVTASENVDLVLCSREKKDVKSVKIANEQTTFSIVPSGNTDATGDIIWTIEKLASAPLDTSLLDTAVGNAISVEAKEFAEEVSDSSELAKYGLDKPKASVSTTFSDGSEFSYMIGNDVPNSATALYMSPDGKKVYTMYKSKTSSYTTDEYGFVSHVATPAYDQNSGEEVMKLTVERVDLDQPIVLENIIPEDEDSIAVYSYRMITPYSAYIDLTDGPSFVYSIFGVNASEVIATDLREEEYGLVGLDKPNCVITAETNKKTYVLTLGAAATEEVTDDEGNTSQRITGFYGISSEVPGVLFMFDTSSIPALSVNPSKLLSKLFLMPYIFDLDSIDYSDNTGRKLNIGIKVVSEGEANKEAVNEFTLNGEKYDEQGCKDLYQYFISAAGEELYLDSGKGDLIAEITYNYKDRSDGIDGKDTVRLYNSDTDRKVVIELNGENLFKTRQMYATQLLANIDRFLNGEKVVLTY